MNKLNATLLGALLLLTTSVIAQKPSAGNNFFGAKVLFIDYQVLNDGESNFTNGLEVFYRRNINNYLAVGAPLKAGFIEVGNDLNNRNFFSIDAILRGQYYQPSAVLVPYVFAGVGYVSESNGLSNSQIPIGAGVEVRIGQSSYLNLQGEYRKSAEDQRDNLQIGLGYVYRLGKGIEDRDGDGVPDEEDACPDIAGEKKLAGCPDSDGDGIIDLQDACPDIAGVESAKGCPDKDGDGFADKDDNCLEIPGEVDGCPDSDGDGVIDILDKCPDVKAMTEDGCPEKEPDSDGDGFLDSEDNCPQVFGLLKGCPDRDDDGFADKDDNCPDVPGPIKGCPEVVDTDGDGVPDNKDQCPEEAGALFGCPDTDGDGVADKDDKCPEVVGLVNNAGCPEIKEEDRKVLDFAMRAVRFKTGSAILLSESYQTLDQVASIMERYPDYHLQVIGHTDNVGNDENNLILSEDRAKACYAHLITKGISPDRLSYIGYGETQPIGDNSTSAGRLLNRRVEFKLYLP